MPPGSDPGPATPSDGLFGLRTPLEEARVGVIPVPWAATLLAGGGTADGPRAVLRASRNVGLLDRETGRPHEAGIAAQDLPEDLRAWSDAARARAAPVLAAGGPGDDAGLLDAVAEVDALCERMNARVLEQASRLLGQGRLAGILGGDASVSLGGIRAAAAAHPGLGILRLGAHAGLRRAHSGFRYSHASVLDNVVRGVPDVARLVLVGVRDYCDEEEAAIRAAPSRIRSYFEADLRRLLQEGERFSRLAGRMVADLPRDVYVSFHIDGFDPSLCPHTEEPVPGGLGFGEACGLLRTLVESGRRVAGFDLVGVAPDPQGRSEWDAEVGARVLYKLIGFALLSRP